MIKIGCLSDTHGFLHEKLIDFFSDVDEIWHAGDIGNISVADRLNKHKPLRAVYGNIDDGNIRRIYSAHEKFSVGLKKVWLTHIGGYPGNYDRMVRDALKSDSPDIFICGHSHILRVMFDKNLNLLYINPGAAGKSGFHSVMTALRFKIDGDRIFDMEVWEMKRG
jgi:uncharacterized protein